MTKTLSRLEVPFNDEWLGVLFSNLSENDILVGGQALIFWAGKYNLIPKDIPVVTDDADVLSNFDAVSRLSSSLNAVAIYPPKKGFGTALHGQVEINLNSREYLNIDVLRKVYGIKSDSIIKRAVKHNGFYVMNPLDVFISKITNYADLEDKQDENGKTQALIAIEILKKTTMDFIDQGKIKEAVSIAQTAFKLGKSAVGKNAIKIGVNPFDAIVFDIPNDHYQKEWVPRVREQINLILSNSLEDGDDSGIAPS